MQQLSSFFPRWVRISHADLALVAIYVCFVAINLGAACRGDLSVLVLIVQECCVIILALRRMPTTTSVEWDSPEALLGWCGMLTPLFVRPAALAPTLLLFVGVAAQGVGNIFAVAGICDLGRSFGIIAANRGIKTRGLYRSVRHPIYAAYLLAFGGFVLAHPSLRNGLVLLACAGIQIARIRAEERLLMSDPCYRVYAMQVRYRLFPGIW